MSDEAKLLEDMRRASIATVVQQLRAIHELNQAAGPPPARAKGGGGDSAHAANDYVLGLARLLLHNYDAQLRFQSRHFDYLASRVREFNRLYRPAGGPAAHTTLRFKGAPGEDVSQGLRVENPGGGAADISFNTSEFRDGDGGLVAAPVRVVARGGARRRGGERRLAPGAEQTFDVSVRLDPGLFAAGGRYEAETIVLLEGTIAARVTLVVDVAATAPKARAAARKGAKGRRRGAR